ncbi:hypothetical protein DDZ14_08520 [Maritimibacter sp. 55A14]|uniref:hypothetical protein n=1 Tax=Maritimibacter sp. 55A14 TaxID=2174844 RepID=UPI000D61FDB2|nr:hypothetical protein [Maritimibacter sp. 55A14]PWE32780.1 hypothetical protein DDZ14_08520 [Maritimibacter sp. 55A14]
MKRLDLNPEPKWLKIDDELSIQIRPVTQMDVLEILRGTAVSDTVQKKLEAAGLSALASGDPNDQSEDEEEIELSFNLDQVHDLFTISSRIFEKLVVGWTVVDMNDEPIPVSAEAAAALVRSDMEIMGTILVAVLEAADTTTEVDAEKKG